MMSRLAIVLTVITAVLTLMTVAWIVSLVRRDASVVDRAWGLAPITVAWVAIAAAAEPTARSYLAASLVTIWGVRLSAYLAWRSRGEGEDWRYTRLRERHRERFAARSLVTIFWAQGIAAVMVGLPLLASVRAGQPDALGWIDAVGVAVWTLGFTFEVVGDWQLARFRADPANRERGRVLDTGLWRYTRHPNYFGDATAWWGIGLIGLAAGAWWALLGPLGMTIVFLRGTGIAQTEPHLHESRGGAYRRYVEATSAFVPLPRRSRSGGG